MRIGIVTSRSQSGEEGGAERFYDALVDAFRSSGHDAAEIPVAIDESSFDRIKLNYLKCYDLELSSFDMVLSTKAPTWMIRHPRHVCYLVHTIRVFYDMFDAAFPNPLPEQMDQRALIHDLDTAALSQPRCRRVFSIGHEVSDRLQEWNGVTAEVLHPPLWSNAFRSGAQGDYLLLPGRLHPWKRVDLAIRAMGLIEAPLRLIITGSGECEEDLRRLAEGDPRIQFRGRVTDEELLQLYAGAFGVVFTPLREDYGYVTMEAFASGKPVVTCSDSGEAAKVVASCGGGLVSEPSPEALARSLGALWNDRPMAKNLGRVGKNWVERLAWSRVVDELIAAVG